MKRGGEKGFINSIRNEVRIKLMNDCLENNSLYPFLVYYELLARMGNESMRTNVGAKRLQDNTGISKSSIYRATKFLSDKGYVISKQNGENKSNIYFFPYEYFYSNGKIDENYEKKIKKQFGKKAWEEYYEKFVSKIITKEYDEDYDIEEDDDEEPPIPF